MSKHTTFKVGGPCDMLINPESADELVDLVRDLINKGTPYFIMGNGSNLLVSDDGIRGTVIEISREMSRVEIIDKCEDESDDESEDESGDTCGGKNDGDTVFIKAEAGIMLSRLASYVFKEGLSGLEEISGIPGTLGGAVFMNAGAYGGEISQVLVSTEYYDIFQNKIITLNNEQHEFGYRYSIFQKNNGIILKSTLKLKRDDKTAIKSRMDDYSERRKSKQPLEYPSAGSTFKRPEGYFAGKLIQDAGLSGYSAGGAQVSEKHSGFIINTGNATAADILELIKYVKNRVYDKFGVELKEEVRII